MVMALESGKGFHKTKIEKKRTPVTDVQIYSLNQRLTLKKPRRATTGIYLFRTLIFFDWLTNLLLSLRTSMSNSVAGLLLCLRFDFNSDLGPPGIN